MKNTGMTRPVDELGRIVIPMEVRKVYDIEIGTPMEIFTEDGGMIILKKYNPGCTFCSDLGELKRFSGHWVCRSCRFDIGKLLARRGE